MTNYLINLQIFRHHIWKAVYEVTSWYFPVTAVHFPVPVPAASTWKSSWIFNENSTSGGKPFNCKNFIAVALDTSTKCSDENVYMRLEVNSLRSEISLRIEKISCLHDNSTPGHFTSGEVKMRPWKCNQNGVIALHCLVLTGQSGSWFRWHCNVWSNHEINVFFHFTSGRWCLHGNFKVRGNLNSVFWTEVKSWAKWVHFGRSEISSCKRYEGIDQTPKRSHFEMSSLPHALVKRRWSGPTKNDQKDKIIFYSIKNIQNDWKNRTNSTITDKCHHWQDLIRQFMETIRNDQNITCYVCLCYVMLWSFRIVSMNCLIKSYQ